MENLYSTNTPERFWRCLVNPTKEQWHSAIEAALPIFGFSVRNGSVDSVLETVLGEGMFGSDHWRLSPVKRLYYMLKPALPRSLTRNLRRLYGVPTQGSFLLGWPIEDRYVRFQWEVMRHVLNILGESNLPIVNFWPLGNRYALVLTHDVESQEGLAHVREIADLEISLGFRSSFNFVPERYPPDYALFQELRDLGFEVGIHGLKHDGKLFNSKDEFDRRAKRINHYLKEFDAAGFRAPLTHRQPEWMQTLDIEYDLSFFDTDPFEPIPGGTMSIWPFELGGFIELPYTLVQDYTLTMVLDEKTPRIWLQKVEFIEKYFGMVLLNSHPDYLRNPINLAVYEEFLRELAARENYWHALPREVAAWWRSRTRAKSAYRDGQWTVLEPSEASVGVVGLSSEGLKISQTRDSV